MKVMLKKFLLASLIAIAFTCGSCQTDNPITDPDVIVITPQSVPYLIKPGVIVPFNGYFVTQDQLLVMRNQIPSEYEFKVKRGDMIKSEGYLIHSSLVVEKDKKLKFK